METALKADRFSTVSSAAKEHIGEKRRIQGKTRPLAFRMPRVDRAILLREKAAFCALSMEKARDSLPRAEA